MTMPEVANPYGGNDNANESFDRDQLLAVIDSALAAIDDTMDFPEDDWIRGPQTMVTSTALPQQ